MTILVLVVVGVKISLIPQPRAPTGRKKHLQDNSDFKIETKSECCYVVSQMS